MRSPLNRLALSCLLVFFALESGADSRAEEFTFHHENVLGTSAEFRIQCNTLETAVRAEKRLLEEIDRLRGVYSTYESDSDIRRWLAGENGDRVSSELFDLLAACDRYEKLTGGAFNPRVSVASGIWSNAVKGGKPPVERLLREAAALCARPVWNLEESTRTASILPGAKRTLAVDAIAKGRMIDQAADSALQVHGVDGVVVNIGGDIRAAGVASVRVWIRSPHEQTTAIASIEVRKQAIATSGGYERFFEIQGQRYSHIIDPRTARPAGHSTSVSVIAPTAAAADAVATALNVMKIEDALQWCEFRDEYDCLIVDSRGKQYRSDGWPTEEKLDEAVRLVSTGVDQWARDAKLTVSFEINRQITTRYRRPYVAIWVEDSDGFPVRTLVLWLQEGRGARWHRDLRRWYKQDRVRQLVDGSKLIGTVSAATRPPGRYKATWDGKDDQGKPVAKGEYTLYIEAAREHGTYQLIRQSLTLGTKALEGNLKGNEEIKSAHFVYQP